MKYSFGGNTGETAESIRRKRELARAILERSPQAPSNLGEGLHSFGAQIAAAFMDRRANSAYDKERAARKGQFDAILQGLPSAQPQTAPRPQTAPQAAPSDDLVQLASLDITDMSNPEFHYGRTATANAKPFRGMVVHHTADKPIENLVQYGQTVDAERGGAFGYHYYIGKDGQIIQGAPLDKRTNHIKGPGHSARRGDVDLSNSDALGISLVGAEHGATPEQLASAERLAKALMAEHGITPENIYGHGDLQTDRQHTEGAELVQALKAMRSPQGVQPQATQQAPQQAPQRQGVDPRLMQVLSDPFMTDGERMVAQMLLQQQMEASRPPKPMSEFQRAQLGMDQARLGMDQARFGLEQGSSALDQKKFEHSSQLDELRLKLEQLKFERDGQISPLQREKLDLEERRLEAQIAGLIGGGTTVNVGAGENAFEKATGKAQAEQFSTWAEAGVNAAAEISQVRELRRLVEEEGVGGTADVYSLWVQNNLGINTGVGSAVEAFDAMISRLVPTQRPPGSGQMSDRDVELFKRSLPQLINTPEGNGLILDTMEAMAQYKRDVGKIANDAVMGTISRADAQQALQALPDPMEAFRRRQDGQSGAQASQQGSAAGETLTRPDGIPEANWQRMPEARRRLAAEAWPLMGEAAKQQYLELFGGGN